MYPVSEAYKKALLEFDRVTKIEGTMTLTDGTVLPFTDADILAGTLSIDNACVSGEELQLGAVYMGQLNASINTNITRYKAYDAKIVLSFFLQLADGTFEEVPLGEYKVKEATRKDDNIDIVSYDNMIKLSDDFNKATSGTPFEILQLISENTGVELAQTEEQINAMSAKNKDGSVIQVGVSASNAKGTYRDLLSDVATILGGFGTINRFGKIEIRRFGTDEVIISNIHRKKTDYSDFDVKYDGIIAKMGDDKFTAGGKNGEILAVESSLWQSGLTETKQALLDNVWSAIENITYTPSTIDYVGDPALELGDRIKYTEGKIGSQATYSYLMKNTWKHKNVQRLVAVGKDPLVAAAQSKNDKAIADINNTMKTNELKIIAFQSAGEIPISQDEFFMGRITLVGAEDQIVSLNGQAVMNITKPGTIIVKYKVNDVFLTYTTRQIATYVGDWTVHLFYPVSELKPGKENKIELIICSTDGAEGVIKPGDFIVNTIGVNAGKLDTFSGLVELSDTLSPFTFSGPLIAPFDATPNHKIN